MALLCKDCGVKFQRKEELQAHTEADHYYIYTCPSCPESGRRRKQLWTDHVSKAHSSVTMDDIKRSIHGVKTTTLTDSAVPVRRKNKRKRDASPTKPVKMLSMESELGPEPSFQLVEEYDPLFPSMNTSSVLSPCPRPLEEMISPIKDLFPNSPVRITPPVADSNNNSPAKSNKNARSASVDIEEEGIGCQIQSSDMRVVVQTDTSSSVLRAEAECQTGSAGNKMVSVMVQTDKNIRKLIRCGGTQTEERMHRHIVLRTTYPDGRTEVRHEMEWSAEARLGSTWPCCDAKKY